MKIIKKTKKVSLKEYYTIHLNIINSMFPRRFTEKEIEVLSSFMSLDKSIIGTDVFNTYARKLVREKLKISSGGLSNYLGSMIDKNHLLKDKLSNRITIQEYLIPEDNQQLYQFILIKNEDEQSTVDV